MSVKRIGKILAGVLIVLGGLALLVLPGPGLLVLAAGLVLLATEIPPLQRLLARGFARLPDRMRAKTPDRLRDVLEPDRTYEPTATMAGQAGAVRAEQTGERGGRAAG